MLRRMVVIFGKDLFSVVMSIVLVISSVAAQQKTVCLQEYMLTFHQSWATFSEAKDSCNKGGEHLIKAVGKEVLGAIEEAGSSGQYYLGLKHDYGKVWKWQDNETLYEADSNWSDGEPNGPNEECVAADLSHRGKWIDVLCGTKRYYICQRSKVRPRILGIRRKSCTSNITAIHWSTDEHAVGSYHRVSVFQNSFTNKELLFEEKVIPTTNRQETEVNLLPSSPYRFEVQACITGNECPYVAEKNVTNGGTPDAPVAANLHRSGKVCYLAWENPSAIEVPITHYKIEITEVLASSRNSTSKNTNEYIAKGRSLSFPTLPNRKYTARLSSVSHACESSPVLASKSCVSPPQTPTIVEAPTFLDSNVYLDIPNEKKGLMSCLLLVVCQRPNNRESMEFSLDDLLITSLMKEDNGEYIAIAISADRFAGKKTIKVSLGENDVTFCNSNDVKRTDVSEITYSNWSGNATILGLNRPLESNFEYWIYVVSVVPSGNNLLFKKSANSYLKLDLPVSNLDSELASRSWFNPKSYVIGLASTVLCVALIAIARRYYLSSKIAKCETRTTTEITTDLKEVDHYEVMEKIASKPLDRCPHNNSVITGTADDHVYETYQG